MSDEEKGCKVSTAVKGGMLITDRRHEFFGSMTLTRPHHLYLLHSLLIPEVWEPSSVIHLECRSPRALRSHDTDHKLIVRFRVNHRRVLRAKFNATRLVPQLPQPVWNPLEHRLSFGSQPP